MLLDAIERLEDAKVTKYLGHHGTDTKLSCAGVYEQPTTKQSRWHYSCDDKECR